MDNRALATVYVLKDDLKRLWDYSYEGAAKRFWDQWYGPAMRSRIEPLKKFARNLSDKLGGILAHCRWPLHTSLLEETTTRSKSSTALPTASATTTTSSSKSVRPSPEFSDEKNKRA
jgi:transposase